MESTKENPFEFFKDYFKEGYKNDLIGYGTEKRNVREYIKDEISLSKCFIEQGFEEGFLNKSEI